MPVPQERGAPYLPLSGLIWPEVFLLHLYHGIPASFGIDVMEFLRFGLISLFSLLNIPEGTHFQSFASAPGFCYL